MKNLYILVLIIIQCIFFEIHLYSYEMYGFGSNDRGSLGIIFKNWIPNKILQDSNWAQISSGYYKRFAIKKDGSLWSWDKDSLNQVSTDKNWSSIISVRDHNIALKTNGTLWAWGLNEYGQLGIDSITKIDVFTKIGNDSDWVSFSTSNNHTMAIKANGTLWGWGNNTSGQLGDSTNISVFIPKQIGDDTDWVSVSCGGGYTLAIKKNATLWAWGSNSSGELGLEISNLSINYPNQVGTESNWASALAGWGVSTVLKNDGTIWSCGDNQYGQLGYETESYYGNDSLIQIGNDNDWAYIYSGLNTSAAIKNDGSFWIWGSNVRGQYANGTLSGYPLINYTPLKIESDVIWTYITFDEYNVYAIKDDGTIWGWGSMIGSDNPGYKSYNNYNYPTQINTDTNWISFSFGIDYNTFAQVIKQDGTLWGWGAGIIGDGKHTLYSFPVQIGNDRDWAKVKCGEWHSLALKTNGTLWAWGDNYRGPLGDGTEENRYTPVQIGNETNWSSISCGFQVSFAIKSDGTLWSWGSGFQGALGIDQSILFEPTQVGTDTNWALVSCEGSSTLVIKTDGTLWSIGNRENDEDWSPRQVGTDSDWATISMGLLRFAIKTDGTLWGWGNNEYGQLGDTTNIDCDTIKQIGKDNDWVSVYCSYYHTLAIKKDGTLWSWGKNNEGQLGDGTKQDRNYPLQIAKGKKCVSAGCGWSSSFMLVDNSTNFIEDKRIDNNIIILFPNPAKDYINIRNSNFDNIKIYNLLGECVMEIEPAFQFEENDNIISKIDISNLSAGIYFVRIGNVIKSFVKE